MSQWMPIRLAQLWKGWIAAIWQVDKPQMAQCFAMCWWMWGWTYLMRPLSLEILGSPLWNLPVMGIPRVRDSRSFR